MTFLAAVIAFELTATVIGAGWFVVTYGRPWRYLDRTMAWHLTTVTAVIGVEALGLLTVRLVGMGPLVVIYGATAGIIYWRLWLLLRTRRRNR